MSVDSAVALISAAQAKAFLKISGSTEDAMIEALVNRASKLASTYCGRKFVSAQRTEYHDAVGQDHIILNNYPVASVASLHEDITRAWSATTLISSDDYMLETESGIVRLWNGRSRFLQGRGAIRAIYTAGYTAGSDMPYDLEHAVCLIVLFAYKRHYQDQKIGISSENVGDKQTTFELVDIPKSASKILDNYRAANNSGHAF